MPMIVYRTDEIAREKGRDILYLDFIGDESEYKDKFFFKVYDYEKSKIRAQILRWLDDNGFSYLPCLQMLPKGMSASGDYSGSIYIDVPYDVENEQYQKLQQYLENEDGSMKFDGVEFYYLPLKMAIENTPDETDEDDF